VLSDLVLLHRPHLQLSNILLKGETLFRGFGDELLALLLLKLLRRETTAFSFFHKLRLHLGELLGRGLGAGGGHGELFGPGEQT